MHKPLATEEEHLDINSTQSAVLDRQDLLDCYTQLPQDYLTACCTIALESSASNCLISLHSVFVHVKPITLVSHRCANGYIPIWVGGVAAHVISP